MRSSTIFSDGDKTADVAENAAHNSAERRREAFEVLEQAAGAALRYRSSVASGALRVPRSYQALRSAGDGGTPEHGVCAGQAIEELIAFAEPGLLATTGPRFFGWVVGASHPLGVAADWLTSAWGQNCGNPQTAPAAAVAEEVAARWLLDILRLPPDATVGFVSGTTMASFACLAAARSHVLLAEGWDVDAKGLFGAPPIQVLVSEEAHTSVFLALRMLGLGDERVHRVKADHNGAMRADHFHTVLRGCAGPTIVIAQAGHISTGAFDPVAAILPAVRARGAWLHIDGAFGLWARACPQLAHLTGGLEAADSWATDGHKWLQVPYETGYAIVAHGDAHRRALAASASYLSPVGDEVRDPTQYVPELSRRARGFTTWAMLRHLGRDGVAAMVARHCRVARRMAAMLAAEPDVSVLNEVVLNQVIVRFGTDLAPESADAVTREVIRLVQAGGQCFVSGARWKDRWVMRVSVISWPTWDQDAEAAVAHILGAWRDVGKRHG
ncbi:aminotransferase class V-fold PLP-dependent enzyme [Cupriavidus necator]|uniref:pyridoxal phosphate-dependent decarboxylase family protein n=1 Tax=Cupriavidus necator TaxID=106590 RepID=UPI00339D7579